MKEVYKFESKDFHQGESHRDAGLERVAIYMAKEA
jgi:hypothetical protein